MDDWQAALIGMIVVLGMKTLDSVFKVIDRLLDHKLDHLEEDDDNDDPRK